MRLRDLTEHLASPSTTVGPAQIGTLPADDPVGRAADCAIAAAQQARDVALAERSVLLEERAALSPMALLRESRRLEAALQAVDEAIAAAKQSLTLATAERVTALT